MTRRVHVVLGSLLTLGAAGLTIGVVWAAGVPTYPCAEGVPHPSSWIFAGLLLFAGGTVAAVLVGSVLIEEPPIVRWTYLGIALVESATAVWLASDLSAKYSHYMCG